MTDTDPRPLTPHPGSLEAASARSRQCLKCKASFPSAWSGERICSRCKTSKLWKSYAPPVRSFTIGRGY